MESRNIICNEHNGVNLFVSIFCTVIIMGVIFLIKKSPPIKKVDQIAVVIALIVMIGGDIYCFMQYMNKRLILRGNEIICINGYGRERTYTVYQIKKVKIYDSVSLAHVKIIFEDGYSYTVNGIATNYSELESIAKKEWQ